MMENYEDEGISLGQIFKVIFRRWKLLLFITGIIFVFGLLGSQLIYNKLKTKYSTEVSYNVANVSGGTYIDNSKFNYRDLIKLSNLESIKKGNTEYSNIDVEKMCEDENISIVKNVKDNSTDTQTATFTLTVSGKYFKNAQQAKNFMFDVLNQTVVNTVSIVSDSAHDTNLKAFNESNDYDSAIYYLEKQVNYLTEVYDQYITLFGDINAKNGTTTAKISVYKTLLETYFGKDTTITSGKAEYKVFEDLKNELAANYYVKNFTQNKIKLEKNMEALNKKIEDNNKVIEKLYAEMDAINPQDNPEGVHTIPANADGTVYQPYSAEISKLTVENGKMQIEIDKISNEIAKQGGDAEDLKKFEASLKSSYDKLVEFTTELNNVTKDVVTENSSTDYVNKSITSSGGLGLIMSVLLFLVGGFVVAAIVNLIIDRKYLKEDLNQLPANTKIEAPKQEEAKEESTKEE